MDWGAIATISAVILAAMFAGIGYIVRLNKEKRCILCITLYNLLEIWYQIRISFLVNPKEIIAMYLEELNTQAPELEITEEVKEVIQHIYTRMWPQMLTTVGKNTTISIEDEYNKSVVALAEFDPVLAYKLSANQALKSLLSILNDYFEQIQEASKNNIDEVGMEEIDITFSKMKALLSTEVLRGLERDILWLSFQISTPMFIRTAFKVFNKRNTGAKETKKMIKVLVSQTIIASIKSSNK